MVIYGTRPEAVKMAPLIKALQVSEVLEPIVVSTGQHREMMDQVNAWFQIQPDLDLNVFKDGSTLNELAARILNQLDPVLAQHKPDAVVVQGDTTTVAVAAVACFYRLIPVVHLEAGLRSGDIHSPFPEEANRKLAGQVTALHLAPTSASMANLIREGVPHTSIVVAGNTVVDALNWTVAQDVTFADQVLAREYAAERPMILLTTHRRENWGEPMRRIGAAVAEIARRYPSHLVVFPMHKNPLVREQVLPSIEGLENVHVTEPLDYPEFVHAQKWACLVLTDSGGVQEEAPSFGKPVLVLRDNTERPEAVSAGTVKLVGTTEERIVAETVRLLDDEGAYNKMAQAVNPYGDGRAAERSVAAIAHLLGVGQRIANFQPTGGW
ncbi:UDP-N-acetylglucosamine 2-epimerase (non-hydrolyzing) [Propioniciclava sinopodophylli]|uniref:UDP-N-acetylglucosamine 2-epimerase (non-hydrolyzing) n=2 Tax=Propioniciclava sinopodophylli TaxID=1837344 RepID=A0A4Q9KCR4_9ACTN|nr:UDP-N-acetylglucosamine 2-epimerase (non-hydrolyzing) [Propioniciclava sinopodophylli]